MQAIYVKTFEAEGREKYVTKCDGWGKGVKKSGKSADAVN